MSTGETETKPLGRLVAERFVVAVIFGALVNFLLTLQIVSAIPAVAKLRQDGASIGLYLATSWNDLLSSSGVMRPAGTTHISIVDINEASCEAIASRDRCHFDRIGHPEVLDAALAAADKTRAKLIVFDILFPTAAELQGSDAGRRLRARLDGPGPPIVAPIAFGNNSIGALSIDLSNSICGRLRCGRLRFAPAYVIEKFKTAREYPLSVPVDFRSDPAGANAPKHRIPSLVLAAAQEAGMPLQGTTKSLPIIFTLPSFATLTDPADQDVLAAQNGKYFNSVDYQHIAIGRDGKSFALGEKAGVVLIVGSSAPITNDWHDTPLGEMAGMEVVANAIRSIELSGTEPARAPRSASNGLWFFAFSWAVLFATIFGIAWVERERHKFDIQTQIFRSGWRLGVNYSIIVLLAIVALGFLAELGGKTWEIVDELREPDARTGEIDVIFPLLAIFFTTAVDLSHRLLGGLERCIGWVFDWAREGVGRLRSIN